MACSKLEARGHLLHKTGTPPKQISRECIHLKSAPQTKQTLDNLLSGTLGASVLASKAKDCLALVSVIFKACTNSLLLGGSDDFLTNSDFDLANSGSGFTLAVPFFCRICLKAVAFSGENPCPGEYPDDVTEFFEGVE